VAWFALFPVNVERLSNSNTVPVPGQWLYALIVLPSGKLCHVASGIGHGDRMGRGGKDELHYTKCFCQATHRFYRFDPYKLRVQHPSAHIDDVFSLVTARLVIIPLSGSLNVCCTR